MSGTVLEIILTAAVVVCALAVVAGIGFRLSRSHRDLGTDADLATYRTLHTAALASKHLRSGLSRPGAAKAARHLRELLGSNLVVITDDTDVLACDGVSDAAPTGGSAQARGSAKPGGTGQPGASAQPGGAAKPGVRFLPMAVKAMASGRTQVFRSGRLQPRGDQQQAPLTDTDMVFVPIRAGDRVVGTVGAGGGKVSASLIRACNEVAAWMATQVELAELDTSRTLLMEAQVRALRAQISPHFIYNSLNAIASFINTDPVRARELVLEFADFTRYSFRSHGDFTTIAEELKSIDRYLLLERARFGERLNVTLHIGPEVLSTVIPFLSLQPLVENAVRHGIEARVGPGKIIITAQDAGAFAEVRIEDDGAGMEPERARQVLAGETDGGHVGLRNVDLRLRRLYGRDSGLVIETAPGEGTLITIRIPKFQPENRT